MVDQSVPPFLLRGNPAERVDALDLHSSYGNPSFVQQHACQCRNTYTMGLIVEYFSTSGRMQST